MKRLRGLNFGGWLSQIDAIEEKDPSSFTGIDNHMKTFINNNDFLQISRWNFNHIRLPIDYNYFFESDAKPIESRFKYLDEAFSFALANNLLLMLDLHRCPGHTFDGDTQSTQKLFVDDNYIKKTVKIWDFLSSRYGCFKNALFEVLNEPVAPDAQTWNKLKNTLCESIRKNAGDIPIIVGSNMWNWPSTYKDLTPIEMDNVIYCFHFYEPLLFTHQKAPWLGEPEFLETRNYPGDYGPGVVRQYGLVMSSGKWNKERIEKEIEPVLRFRDMYKVPIICNEFGTYVQAPRQDHLKWLDDFLSVLKKHDMGFSYWNYKNLDFGIISQNENKHALLKRYNNPQSMDKELLSILQSG